MKTRFRSLLTAAALLGAGGLFVSGAISLVIIPVLYFQVERFKLRRAAA